MRSPRHSDFLISEEALDESVEFFAPSTDASSPAAADALVETTPGYASGRLPPDDDRWRGSAWATPSFPRRCIVGAALVGSCATLVALISGSTSIKHEPSTTTPSKSVSAASADHAARGSKHVFVGVHHRRRTAPQGRHAGEPGRAAAVRQHSTPVKPHGYVRQLEMPPPLASSPMPAKTASEARPAREFEFER